MAHISDEYDAVLDHVSAASRPSQLKITDMRFADISGAPMHCTLMKLYTNQGLIGYGEVRDAATKTYALMLKRLLLGENPCNVDRLFRRIKQFGGPARQGGGVSGVEVALWDLAGKAFGVPVYQMLGGKFRDAIRIYCDTDVAGKPDGMRWRSPQRTHEPRVYLSQDGCRHWTDRRRARCAKLPAGLRGGNGGAQPRRCEPHAHQP
jgi:L-alanine-DL-glutamate epimerase-like enolase superfamily enzyme